MPGAKKQKKAAKVEEKNDKLLNQEADFNRAWNWLLNESNLYTNRVNFYIVAQSMFFAAFASSVRQSKVFLIACTIAGIGISLIWFLMSQHQKGKIIAPIREEIKKSWIFYKDISSKQTRILKTHTMLGIVLPWAMIALWIIILLAELWPLVHV